MGFEFFHMVFELFLTGFELFEIFHVTSSINIKRYITGFYFFTSCAFLMFFSEETTIYFSLKKIKPKPHPHTETLDKIKPKNTE